MSSSLWDIIVIGGGSAGLACAIRGAELGLNILILETCSDKVTNGILFKDNFSGFYSVSRQEILESMVKQVRYYPTLKHTEKVTKLELHDNTKYIYSQTANGDYFTEQTVYKAKTVLITTGLHPTQLGIPNEWKFKEKGILYSPPAGDYNKKEVIIIGHTSWAVRTALYYDSMGANVYLISKRVELDTHPTLNRRINDSFVNIMLNHEILMFEGVTRVSSTFIKNREGERFRIPTDLVLILTGKSSNRTLFLDAGLAINSQGRIIVNEKQETNFSGVFAAGSATREDSIIGVSASEGIKVADSVFTLLQKKKQIIQEKHTTDKKSLNDNFNEGNSILIEKVDLTPEIIKWVIYSPEIAKKALPGQFVVLRVHDKGERIPLTIADSDKEHGTITLIFQKIGKTTKLMGSMKVGDHILNFLGPLGQPVEIKKYGTVAVLGGGCGVAPILPKAKALKKIGNYIIGIISARTSSLLICREEMREVSNELYIATDDGTEGYHGFGLDVLLNLLNKGRKINHVVVVGPIPMMKFTCIAMNQYEIPTTVSLAPLMVDGTGMCGACRVTVDGEVKFACVDGPNFNGHKVDFDELERRSQLYRYEEQISSEKMTINT